MSLILSTVKEYLTVQMGWLRDRATIKDYLIVANHAEHAPSPLLSRHLPRHCVGIGQSVAFGLGNSDINRPEPIANHIVFTVPAVISAEPARIRTKWLSKIESGFRYGNYREFPNSSILGVGGKHG